MKKILSVVLAIAILLCMCAVVPFADGNDALYYLKSNTSENKFIQGDKASLRLYITDTDRKAIDFCDFKATLSIPFEISEVTYKFQGGEIVSVEPIKADTDTPASITNPYTFDIVYSSDFNEDTGALSTASGYVVIEFIISELAQTGLVDIITTNIEAYVDKLEESTNIESIEPTSSELTSNESAESGSTSGESIESENTSSEFVVNEITEWKHVKAELSFTEYKVGDVNGNGKTLRIRINAPGAVTLKGLFIEGIDINPDFSEYVNRYSATVPSDMKSLLIGTTIGAGVAVDFRCTKGNATITTDGLLTFGTDSAVTVRMSVTAPNQSANVYFIDLTRDIDITPSSETPSEPVHDPSSELSDKTVSEYYSEIQADPSSNTPVITPADNEFKIDVVPLLLIIILSFACGFVFCLILVKSGAISGKDPDDDFTVGYETVKTKGNINNGHVDENAFNKASEHQTMFNDANTATRILPMDNIETKKMSEIKREHFEIDFAFTDEGIEPSDENLKQMIESTEDEPQIATKADEPQKKNFFFDDDEF